MDGATRSAVRSGKTAVEPVLLVPLPLLCMGVVGPRLCRLLPCRSRRSVRRCTWSCGRVEAGGPISGERGHPVQAGAEHGLPGALRVRGHVKVPAGGQVKFESEREACTVTVAVLVVIAPQWLVVIAPHTGLPLKNARERMDVIATYTQVRSYARPRSAARVARPWRGSSTAIAPATVSTPAVASRPRDGATTTWSLISSLSR